MNIRKLWPQKRWKKIILIIFFIILIVGITSLSYISWSINTDIKSDIVVINDDGISNALLIYHPGFTSFTTDVSYAFADGLMSNNWRIEITTPSDQAPSDISEYDLFIFCTPVYGFGPTPTINRHINRINDFQGKSVITILTAAGSPGNSAQVLREIIEQKNGIVESEIILFSMAPNPEDKNAIDLSEELGMKIIP